MGENTKILLIHPHANTDLKIQEGLKYPPLGIACVAALARKEGYKVKIFDANVEPKPMKRLGNLLAGYKPGIVGLSFTSLLSESAHSIARFVKNSDCGICVLAGGYHPTVMPLEVIEDNNFDFVIAGEGEVTFIEWLREYGTKNNDYEKIKGLVFKRDGKIIQTGQRDFIQDLDSLPLPAYDLLPIKRYSSLVSVRSPYVTFIRSRGCPFNCIFCGVQKMFGRKYRCQSPERTISDIDVLVNKFNVKEILFKDSDFLIDRHNVEEFCKLLAERNYDLVWSCNARVDMVNENILSLMKKAGCRLITYGIESGSQPILDYLKKDITLSQIKNAISLTKKAGLRACANIIFGCPGESRATVEETVRFTKELDPDYASFTYLTAFPGSELYEEALMKSWFIDGKPNSYAYEQLKVNATAMTDRELSGALKYAARSFYFNPGYICKRLKQMTFADLGSNLRGLWAVIKNY